MSANANSSEDLNSVQYRCPNCGGDLRFHPQKQGFACEYCDSFFTPEECQQANSQMAQEAQAQIPAQDAFAEENQVFLCQSCGAELITDSDTSATECVYCHNPVILKGRLSGEYRPSRIIPFQIDKDKATEIFKNWCGKRKFLPKDFTSDSQLIHLHGVYVPFWVADCHIHGVMQAECHKVRKWNSGDYHYKEVKEFDVFREADLHFDGIPADGQSKVKDALMEAIEPFDYRDTVDFDMSYLSGFLSDKYDVNKSQVFPRIRNRAVNGSDQLLRSSMTGYDSVRVIRSDMNILSTKWQYMLLPVWFMRYEYKGKPYDFAINGQTGAQAGTPPLDQKKLGLLCVLIALVCGIIGFIGGLLG
ncbi:MAG: hypothetical protein K2H29_07560 [Oscillospiraceae bacterium]|nr:hypothetical protein [Oscillospiraceae bacterium]